MNIELLDAAGVRKKLTDQLESCDKAWLAVAWATENPVLASLLDAQNRLACLIVGVDFVQTSPHVLKNWCDSDTARVYPPRGGTTFHPKIYLFRKENRGFAIVGSANFTLGGLVTNEEANICIEGFWDEEIFQSLKIQITAWWRKGQTISEDWLAQYLLRWESDKATRDKLNEPFRFIQPSEDSPHSWLQGMDWDKYVQTFIDANDKSLDIRLRLLAKAQDIFRHQDDFGAMTLAERKAIAGLPGPSTEVERTKFDWGWFGSMKGAGEFHSRINSNQPEIAAALACIPLTGAIHRQHYLDFADHFQQAFVGAERKGRVPTASRLLALKRPDYFVCINSKNQNGLSADLGYRKTRVSLDNYWDWVVQPILDSRWWNSRRPRQIGKYDWTSKLWDNRVAMLDSLYF